MSPTVRISAAMACIALALAACSRREEPESSMVGMLIDRQLSEISGMAASGQHRNVLWLIDDGGNAARLFAVSTKGRRRATFTIDGVTKTDWEDLASFTQGGKRYLLVADTGDNGGLRHTLQLHAIAEPSRMENARIRPVWSIAFRWPDGARDCEAVAVDSERGEILLISKKRYPPEVFTLPLRPARGVQTARRIGVLGGVPRDPQRGRGPDLGAQVTAASISPDNRTLAVMTYRHLLEYRRGGGDWPAALATPSTARVLPWLPQAEALTFAADGGSLFATGEFTPAPLYRIQP